MPDVTFCVRFYRHKRQTNNYVQQSINQFICIADFTSIHIQLTRSNCHRSYGWKWHCERRYTDLCAQQRGMLRALFSNWHFHFHLWNLRLKCNFNTIRLEWDFVIMIIRLVSVFQRIFQRIVKNIYKTMSMSVWKLCTCGRAFLNVYSWFNSLGSFITFFLILVLCTYWWRRHERC